MCTAHDTTIGAELLSVRRYTAACLRLRRTYTELKKPIRIHLYSQPNYKHILHSRYYSIRHHYKNAQNVGIKHSVQIVRIGNNNL